MVTHFKNMTSFAAVASLLLFAVTQSVAQETGQPVVETPGIYVDRTLVSLPVDDFAVRTIYGKVGKLERIQASFKSIGTSPEAISYKFSWFEESGRLIPMSGYGCTMEKADGKTEGIHQSVWQGTKKPSHGLPIGYRFPQITAIPGTVVPGNSCPGESNPDLSRCGG